MTILKNKLLQTQLNSTKVSIGDLEKLIPILEEANNESKELEIPELKKSDDFQNGSIDEKQIRALLTNHMTVRVGIFGINGEYIQTDFPQSLTSDQIPNAIKTIIIDNSSSFQLAFKREPMNQFKITLDFKTPYIFDFVSSPSLATPNASSIELLGVNETWVNGNYSKFTDYFKGKKTNRGWIHKSSIYDALLWVLLFPIGLGYLRKIDHWVLSFDNISYSPAFFTVTYLFLLLIIFLIFRILFNYLRWLYPYLELEPQNNNPRSWQRKLYYFILAAIFAPLAYDLFISLISAIT